jgi:hypothetical protein
LKLNIDDEEKRRLEAMLEGLPTLIHSTLAVSLTGDDHRNRLAEVVISVISLFGYASGQNH